MYVSDLLRKHFKYLRLRCCNMTWKLFMVEMFPVFPVEKMCFAFFVCVKKTKKKTLPFIMNTSWQLLIPTELFFSINKSFQLYILYFLRLS